jgi:hypothetical protein
VGPFEVVDVEKSFYQWDENAGAGRIWNRWKTLKLLGEIPHDHKGGSGGNIFGTDTGDVFLTHTGELYADYGPGPWGRDYFVKSIDAHAEVYGQSIPSDLTGDELIKYIIGGPFELGEEQNARNKEGVIINTWKMLKLSAPLPREYGANGAGNVFGTDTGDVLLTQDGSLFIDVGAASWEGGRAYFITPTSA